MPQRRRNWTNFTRFNSGSYVDDHDDREKKPNTKRRVSFKPSGGVRDRGPNKGRMELAIKAQLEDDEEMSEFGTSKFRSDKFEKNRRKGSPMPTVTTIRKLGQKKLMPCSFGWYQVTIPYGQKYEKDLIIRNILNAISPDIFIPHYWKQDKTCVIFYLDDIKAAERLLNVDRTIQMPDGFRMVIRVRGGVPLVVIDDNLKERMKLAMAKRYNAATKALDLSKFHADPDLKDIFCGLFRPSIMLAAIDIIAANIPDLEALNLSENQIGQLEHFKCLKEKLPNIKILYLTDNKIQNVGGLQAFRGLSIVELALKDNPVRQRYREESTYISEIRRKFPKLVKLDGKELEPQVVFDVAESTSLPSPKASFLCNSAGGDIIRQFLEQYFIIFDSDNRLPLLEAYHEHVMLSMSLPPASQAGRLSNYWQYNRNILRIHDIDAKSRLVRYGRLPAVSFLSELPKTQHDPQSFSADLTLFTPKLISFTVAGVFKELTTTSSEAKYPEIKSFQRFFVIVPTGNGFCIRNEMIFISNPTPAQLRTAFKPAPAPTPAPTPTSVPAPTPTLVEPVPSTSQAVPAPTIPDEATKLQMIQAMATQSNMNLEWSRKCLEETSWDFNRAAFVFNQLHKENRIPPEAFVK